MCITGEVYAYGCDVGEVGVDMALWEANQTNPNNIDSHFMG